LLNDFQPIQCPHRHCETPGVVHGDLPVSRHDALFQGKADMSTLLKADITTCRNTTKTRNLPYVKSPSARFHAHLVPTKSLFSTYRKREQILFHLTPTET
jgi:hypothetical protein